MLQAVSYEFQKKLGNILGVKTFQTFLVINGWVAPFLIGVAVATFFTGSNFVVEKANFTNGLSPVISSWLTAATALTPFSMCGTLYLTCRHVPCEGYRYTIYGEQRL